MDSEDWKMWWDVSRFVKKHLIWWALLELPRLQFSIPSPKLPRVVFELCWWSIENQPNGIRRGFSNRPGNYLRCTWLSNLACYAFERRTRDFSDCEEAECSLGELDACTLLNCLFFKRGFMVRILCDYPSITSIDMFRANIQKYYYQLDLFYYSLRHQKVFCWVNLSALSKKITKKTPF